MHNKFGGDQTQFKFYSEKSFPNMECSHNKQFLPPSYSVASCLLAYASLFILFFLSLLQLTANSTRNFCLTTWFSRVGLVPYWHLHALCNNCESDPSHRYSCMHSFLIRHGCPYDSNFITSIMFLVTFILQGLIGVFQVCQSHSNKTKYKIIFQKILQSWGILQ